MNQNTKAAFVWYVIMVQVILLVIGPSPTPAQTEPNTVRITWVANHGFQIAGDGKKVLIDTLFTNGGGYYHAPAESILNKMMQGQAPFDGVDAVLTTHSHTDHYDPICVLDYMLRHPNVPFVGPGQTVTPLQARAESPELQARLRTVQGRATDTFNGVDVEYIAIPHHLNDQVQHIAYLVRINGMKVLHMGDATKMPASLYEELALSDEDIDIMIAPLGAGCSNWLVNANGDGISIIRDHIKPKCVIMGHMPMDWTELDTAQAIHQFKVQLPCIALYKLYPQPCTGMLFNKKNGKIVNLPDPANPVENQNTGQRYCAIQYAINDAASGDVIRVEPGIYPESLRLDIDICLQSLDPNDPYYIGSTILQGHTDEPVLSLSNNTQSCVLSGLTLRAGSVGISGTGTHATIRNCRIMDNITHGLELFQLSNPLLENCLITANGQSGITMHAKKLRRDFLPCEPIIKNCTIVDNGAAALVGGESVIVDSVIQN